MSKSAVVLGLILALPAVASAGNRIVGVSSPAGGVALVKKVHVDAGTEIDRIELVSNDLATVFPAIRLRRLAGRSSGDVVTEIHDVSATGSLHRLVVPVSSVVFLAAQDILIEVVLPPGSGADRRGHGAGLGASDLAGSEATSYIGNTATGDLQPIDADLHLAVLGPASAGKSAPPAAEPNTEAVDLEVLTVRTLPDGTLEIETSGSGPSADFQIYDVRGRLVRALSGSATASARAVRWDLHDGQGQRVPAGVYFIATQARGSEIVRKTVVLR